MRAALIAAGMVLLCSQVVAEAYMPRPSGAAVLAGVALLTAGLCAGRPRQV